MLAHNFKVQVLVAPIRRRGTNLDRRTSAGHTWYRSDNLPSLSGSDICHDGVHNKIHVHAFLPVKSCNGAWLYCETIAGSLFRYCIEFYLALESDTREPTSAAERLSEIHTTARKACRLCETLMSATECATDNSNAYTSP